MNRGNHQIRLGFFQPAENRPTLSKLRSEETRRGIILLVVLGMLALFSLLTATYIIFTARSRQASVAIGRRETRSIDTRILLRDAAAQVIRGPLTNDSSLFGHSLLEDYYGRDSIQGKVLNLNAEDPDGARPHTDGSGNTQYDIAPDGRYLPPHVTGAQYFGAEWMLGRSDTGGRNASLLKIPIQLAERVTGNLLDHPPVAIPEPYDVEDALVGRYVVFAEGPLQGFLLKIVRSFGHIPNGDDAVGNRYSVIVDLGPHLTAPVVVNGNSYALRDLMLLSSGATVPYLNMTQLGLLYGTNAGYAFRVTGRPRNGFGYGWQADTNSLYNLNQTFSPARNTINQPQPQPNLIDLPVPVAFQGNFKYLNQMNGAPYIPPGDTDEPLDVPDYHDYLLGYYPPQSTEPLVGLTAPSGIRPALLYYLVNYFGQALSYTSPTSIVRNPTVLDTPQKRLTVLRMLQRACLRPIPTVNDPAGFDVSGGLYAGFTGSNLSPAAAIRQPIDVSRLLQTNANGNDEALHLLTVAQQLIFGPWDVDNDADGVADSVWIDAGMGLITMPDGTLVRPLIAIRMEDLDNRVDVNVVDSSVSVDSSGSVLANAVRPQAFSGSFAGGNINQNSAGDLLGGFGVGPAEIVLQSMFRNGRAANMIRNRYGADSAPGISANLPPSIVPFSAGNDTLAVWESLGRSPLHTNNIMQLFDPGSNNFRRVLFPAQQFGLPIDLHGRSMLALDPFGQPIVNAAMAGGVILPNGTSIANDVVNHPYEMRYKNVSGADFAHSVAELEPILRYQNWDRNEMPGRLRQIVDAELQFDETNTDDPAISRSTLTRAVTTVSATDASPSMSLPEEFQQFALSPIVPGQPQYTIQEQAFDPTTRIAFNLLIDTLQGETPSDAKFETLLSPEVRRGQRLNVNRPFGNGENLQNASLPIAQKVPPFGNLTADEPLELLQQTEALFDKPSNPTPLNPTENVYETAGDFTPQTGRAGFNNSEALPRYSAWSNQQKAAKLQNQHSRAELARHLYAMTMLLISKGSLDPTNLTYNAYDFRFDINANDEEEVRARKIAQWAVNVIDFRDRDAICTRFEYDPNPLDGWDENPLIPQDVPTVVWGMENPELVMTENFNFHDRRVKDTERDTNEGATRLDGGNFVDDDMDQARIPQGTSIIELYCTRGPKGLGNGGDNHHAAPPELYSMLPRSYLDNDSSNDNLNEDDVVPVLDLGRLAPDGNPVWRIGISDRQIPINPARNPLQVLEDLNANPATWDDLTFDPSRDLSYSNQVDPLFRFERVIWFANATPMSVGNALPTDSRIVSQWPNPQNSADRFRVYYNRFASADYRGNVVAGLEGGQYAVVGPRRRTYVGSMPYNSATGPVDFASFVPLQHFDLHPQMQNNFDSGFQAYVPTDNGGNPDQTRITPVPGNSTRSIVPILAAAQPPRNWNNAAQTAPTGIGINISEPLPQTTYYREPQFFMNSDQPQDILNITGYALDSYFDYRDPAAPNSLPDEPFDSQTNAPLAGFESTGTQENWRTAYLQRLADPTAPYDAVLNPYLTVDWMPMDLTVFNGEDNNNQELTDSNGQQEWIDPTDPRPFRDVNNGGRNDNALPDLFASRSKSGIGINPDGSARASDAGQNILWSYGTNPPTRSSQFNIPGIYQPNYPFVVLHRQDWNADYVPSTTYAADSASISANSLTIGFLNHAFGNRLAPGNNAQTNMWAGAPNATPFPWLGFLNRDFASPMELMLVPASSADRLMLEFTLPTAGQSPYAPKTAANQSDVTVQKDFGHLLNFFASSNDVELAPNLYRLLDYVETPDAFIESKELMDPLRLRNPETLRELDAMSVYFPPFNFVTKDLRAGRVNLNTVNNPLVWRALMWMHSRSTERSSGAYWNDWLLSRRGYGNLGSPALDSDIPTQFRGALRASVNGWIAPEVRAESDPTKSLRLSGVQSTLMRENLAGGGNGPLFSRNDAISQRMDRNNNRNPFFRYQTMMRMPNLVSDNSNTYAVWITLGFFEVDPSTLAVGLEYGVESGTNQRPQAFYIIDRSIPVDFVPGQDTDTRKTILLERILE